MDSISHAYNLLGSRYKECIFISHIEDLHALVISDSVNIRIFRIWECITQFGYENASLSVHFDLFDSNIVIFCS